MKSIIKDKIEDIAKCVIDKIGTNDISSVKGLYDGDFGILLFMYSYLKHFDDEHIQTITTNYTENLLNHLGSNHSSTFCGGLSGILYLIEFLRENNIVDIDISCAEKYIDTFLVNRLRNDLQIRNFDFLHGALGVGLYFLKIKTNTNIVHELIDCLHETAELDHKSGGLKWKTVIDIENRIIGYNISLSHGISSIIIFLCRALAQRINQVKSLETLDGCIKYILNQKIDINEYGSFFPNFSIESDSKPLSGSRLAWCYGDLGVAYSIWYAGKTTNNNEWENEGLYILLESTKRKSRNNSRITEAGICHGSAGLIMIYRHLYLETKNNLFLDAVHYWVEQTISLEQFNDGLAGYKSMGIKEWYQDYSLLGGIAGIGLTFISYFSNDSQKWDEMFLL